MHRIFGKRSRKGLMMVAAGVFAATAFASGATAAPAQVEARKAAMADCGNKERFPGQMGSICRSSRMGALKDAAETINADYDACLDGGGSRDECKAARADDWTEWMQQYI